MNDLNKFMDIINLYNYLLKKANFLIKAGNEKITSYIIKKPIFYCYFGWHKFFF